MSEEQDAPRGFLPTKRGQFSRVSQGLRECGLLKPFDQQRALPLGPCPGKEAVGVAEDVDEEAGDRLGGCMPFPAQTQFVLLWSFSMGPYFPAPRAGAATRVLAHDDTWSVLPELSISPESPAHPVQQLLTVPLPPSPP